MDLANLIVKPLAREVVAMNVARISKNLITDNTNADEDSIAVKLGCWAVGELVASKLEPYTDAAVDRASAWINSKRKKNKKTETE